MTWMTAFGVWVARRMASYARVELPPTNSARPRHRFMPADGLMWHEFFAGLSIRAVAIRLNAGGTRVKYMLLCYDDERWAREKAAKPTPGGKKEAVRLWHHII
jgi:hypothetical protein